MMRRDELTEGTYCSYFDWEIGERLSRLTRFFQARQKRRNKKIAFSHQVPSSHPIKENRKWAGRRKIAAQHDNTAPQIQAQDATMFKDCYELKYIASRSGPAESVSHRTLVAHPIMHVPVWRNPHEELA